MEKTNIRRGFTLVEMLVVIAVVAVLVAVIVPTVSGSTRRAKAATDGANLRGTLAKADVMLTRDYTNEQLILELGQDVPASRSFPGAVMYVVNDFPAFIDIYYVDGTDYYGLDYFGKVAEGKNPASLSHAKPTGDSYAADNWVAITKGN